MMTRSSAGRSSNTNGFGSRRCVVVLEVLSVVPILNCVVVRERKIAMHVGGL